MATDVLPSSSASSIAAGVNGVVDHRLWTDTQPSSSVDWLMLRDGSDERDADLATTTVMSILNTTQEFVKPADMLFTSTNVISITLYR